MTPVLMVAVVSVYYASFISITFIRCWSAHVVLRCNRGVVVIVCQVLCAPASMARRQLAVMDERCCKWSVIVINCPKSTNVMRGALQLLRM